MSPYNIVDSLRDAQIELCQQVDEDSNGIGALRIEATSPRWASPAGYRHDINTVDRECRVLADVARYRRTSHSIISATLSTLQDISTGLEDLRVRFHEPAPAAAFEEIVKK